MFYLKKSLYNLLHKHIHCNIYIHEIILLSVKYVHMCTRLCVLVFTNVSKSETSIEALKIVNKPLITHALVVY